MVFGDINKFWGYCSDLYAMKAESMVWACYVTLSFPLLSLVFFFGLGGGS